MFIQIPYGKTELQFNVEKNRLRSVITPREVPPSENAEREIETALRSPIESPTIEALHPRGKTVAIAVDDITRVTPTRLLLPSILGMFEKAGAKDEDITIIVALGTHRRMIERELIEKFGAEVVERYNVINHDFDNQAELEYLGNVATNVPVWINKRYLKADIKVGVGNIIPHCNAGWAGGAKILLPGLAGEETVGRMHILSALTNPNALGMEENPTRRLIEEFARKVGLHLIINTVLTREGEIVKVFAGHFVKAHRKGVDVAKSIYAVRTEGLSDITVSSSYPADLDFWQGTKGLFSGALATKANGAIVLVTPCPEGMSPTHPRWGEYLTRNAEELRKMCREGLSADDDLVSLSLALEIATLREKHLICVVSEGVSRNDTDIMGFRKYDRVEDAIESVSGIRGRMASVNVLTHGGDTYPILEHDE